jgi:hypothetical protein
MIDPDENADFELPIILNGHLLDTRPKRTTQRKPEQLITDIQLNTELVDIFLNRAIEAAMKGPEHDVRGHLQQAEHRMRALRASVGELQQATKSPLIKRP